MLPTCSTPLEVTVMTTTIMPNLLPKVHLPTPPVRTRNSKMTLSRKRRRKNKRRLLPLAMTSRRTSRRPKASKTAIEAEEEEARDIDITTEVKAEEMVKIRTGDLEQLIRMLMKMIPISPKFSMADRITKEEIEEDIEVTEATEVIEETEVTAAAEEDAEIEEIEILEAEVVKDLRLKMVTLRL